LSRGASELVDAHVHFWDPRARYHAWLAAQPELDRPFLPAQLDPGRHRLEAAIVVQADCRSGQALDEVAWFGALADDDRRIRGIVAFAPLEHAGLLGPHLDALVQNPLVVGVRRLLQSEPAAFLTRRDLVAGIRRLAALDLIFDACVVHEQIPQLTDLARACPDVTFVLDHLGKPDVRGRRLDPWRADLAALGRQPNVVCKLSGLGTEAGPGWTAATVRPFLVHALEVFGPERCMFASDWPLVTVDGSHERWTDAVLDVLEPHRAGERAAVLGETARRIYRPGRTSHEPTTREAGRVGGQLHR
jgi:L-fuconolactonase